MSWKVSCSVSRTARETPYCRRYIFRQAVDYRDFCCKCAARNAVLGASLAVCRAIFIFNGYNCPFQIALVDALLGLPGFCH